MQMNPPPVCANCRAPLSPGAPTCYACGAPAAPAQGGYGQPPPYGQPQAAPYGQPVYAQASGVGFGPQVTEAAVRRSANFALVFSLVALPLCCAPLGIVGAVFGFRSMSLAKRAGMPTPARAFISLVLAGLSIVFLGAVIVVGQINARANAKQLGGVQARLDGKRDEAVLEKSTACDLVQERLLADGFDHNTFGLENVKCDGAFTAATDRASLEGVTFTYAGGSKPYTVNACFEHGQRWFELELGTSLDCGAVPLPPWPAGTLTGAALDSQEQKARDAVPGLQEVAMARTFATQLGAIRDAVKAAKLSEAACTKADFAKYEPGGQAMKVDTVDFDYLGAPTAKVDAEGAKEWSWLTSKRVKDILAEASTGTADATPALDRTSDGGPFILVYKAVEKDWPEIDEKKAFLGKKFVYAPGEFEGWMIVANLSTGELSCRGKLAFTNGDDIRYEKGASEKENARQAVFDDFKSHYEDAATAAMKPLTGSALRLGYTLLE